MRSKFAGVALVVLLVTGSWWWIAREPPRELARAEVGDSQPELSSPKPSPANPSGDQTAQIARESRGPEIEVARPDSSRKTGTAFERQESSNRRRAINAYDRRTSSGGEGGEAEHTEFNRFKQTLVALSVVSQETVTGDPIDADRAGLDSDDVDRLDLDRDHAILSWELETVQRLVEQAERFPVKNDLLDGAYPVERGDYRRPEWEFDTVDTNRDDRIDVEEYYSFILDAEKTSLLLDANGDRRISRDESGLSEDGFAPLDRDGSGFLKTWEIRRAIARGELDRDSVAD